MAYQKDLGRVKGDKGNVYVPNLTIENGYLVLTWTETIDNNRADEYISRVKLPVYYPTKSGDQLVFVSNSSDVVVGQDLNLTFDVKGDKGDPGEMKLRTENVSSLESLLSTPENIREDTLYITANDGYVYFINIEGEGANTTYTPVKLEGVNLDNYYTKLETYNRTEIDNMFYDTATYMALMFQLLDVQEPEYTEEPEEEPELDLP